MRMEEVAHCSKNPPVRTPPTIQKKKAKRPTRARRAALLRSLKIKSANRLLAVRIAGKTIPVCVTRTVEIASSQPCGDDRGKLLFALALGLIPNPAKTKTQGPKLAIQRLDPEIEIEARARTKETIFGICRRRMGYLEANVECYLDIGGSLPVSQESEESNLSVVPALPSLPQESEESNLSAVEDSSDEGIDEDEGPNPLPLLPVPSRPIPPPAVINVSSNPVVPTAPNQQIQQNGGNCRPNLWRSVFRPWSNGQNQNGGVFAQLDPELISQIEKYRKAVSENSSGVSSSPRRKGFSERWLSFIKGRTFGTPTNVALPAPAPIIVDLTDLSDTDDASSIAVDETVALEGSPSSGVADLDGNSSEEDVDIIN